MSVRGENEPSIGSGVRELLSVPNLKNLHRKPDVDELDRQEGQLAQ